MASLNSIFVKKEKHSPKMKPIIIDDSDSDIEPEVERIAESITYNLNSALKYTLNPFVEQYNSRRNQHKIISGVLQQLPEFQKLVTENAELKMEINNIKRRLSDKNEIMLEVNEKISEDNDKNAFRKPSIVDSFYKELQESDHSNDELNHGVLDINQLHENTVMVDHNNDLSESGDDGENVSEQEDDDNEQEEEDLGEDEEEEDEQEDEEEQEEEDVSEDEEEQEDVGEDEEEQEDVGKRKRKMKRRGR